MAIPQYKESNHGLTSDLIKPPTMLDQLKVKYHVLDAKYPWAKYVVGGILALFVWKKYGRYIKKFIR